LADNRYEAGVKMVKEGLDAAKASLTRGKALIRLNHLYLNFRQERDSPDSSPMKKLHPLFRTILIASIVFLFAACGHKHEEESTYKVIQKQIFDVSCTQGCHSAGTSFANQSGLVLDSDVSYENLINKTPKNTAAAADNLVLVSTERLPGLSRSFLWKKIDTGHNHKDDHPNYGQLMPIGRDPLTNGELEFIRQWIIAGAPKDGIVADIALLADTTRLREPKVFRPLEPPVRGIHMKLGPFPVQPKFEREFNYYEPNPNTDTVYINRVEISMRPGSHHFILYLMADNTPSSIYPTPRVYRDIRNPDGTLNITNALQMSYHVFFAGTQWPEMDDRFPPGIGLAWPAGKGLDLNSHYVNKASSELQGEVHINLHTLPRNEIQHVARILNINNQNINLPPQQTTTLRYTQTFNREVNIFKLFSHAHQLMREFRVEIVNGPRNGEVIYFTDDWEHPPILTLDPPLTLQAGQGLRLVTTYTNWRTIPVRFGLTSEDEMMILFGYFY
jgi:hypothetical protein